jgi:ribulose-5-phosphate 4-epimerase/fuculose-1-phosphate aldolase
MNQAAQTTRRTPADDVATTRAELACAFRWTARLNMHEATANHFSAAVSDDGHAFLINREGFHFSEIRASDLAHVDSRSSEQPEGLDPTAWAIHGAIHRNNPEVRCALHVHARSATAVACLEDPVLPPIEQNAMRFYERVVVDTGFHGMGLEEEAERVSRLADPRRPILLMGNHGVIALGDCVAQAFDNLYYFERACETWLTVLATGRRYRAVEPGIARLTAEQWERYPDFARKHFDALMRILDREEPGYRE